MAKVVSSRAALILAIVLRGLQAGGEGFCLASDGSPLPSTCAKEATPSTSYPYMLASKGPLQFGLSFRPGPFHNNVPLAIWVNNPTEEEQLVWTCQDLEQFFISGFDVLDRKGVRMMSKAEVNSGPLMSSLGPDAARDAMTCTRNFPIRIPPHSCVHGDFEKPTFDFVKDLTAFYTLLPGRYEITPRVREGASRPLTKGMTIEITQ